MIEKALNKAKLLITEIEKMRDSQVVVFFSADHSLDFVTCYRLNKIVRKLNNLAKLDLVLESPGGDIDAACALVKRLRKYCKKFSVIVPCFCKSAATFVAVSADEQVLCKAAELGVVDPQVKEPITGEWVPAHSIKEAIGFIEETKDPLVKLSLADKLPPLLMGAFRDVVNGTKQYMEEAFEKLGAKKEEAIDTFTTRFLSHGYPIDREMCKEVGLPVVFPENDLEEKICELYEIYGDLTLNLLSGYDMKTVLILQANSEKCIVVDGHDITSELEVPSQQIKRRKRK